MKAANVILNYFCILVNLFLDTKTSAVKLFRKLLFITVSSIIFGNRILFSTIGGTTIKTRSCLTRFLARKARSLACLTRFFVAEHFSVGFIPIKQEVTISIIVNYK
jgi:hypothetical protein